MFFFFFFLLGKKCPSLPFLVHGHVTIHESHWSTTAKYSCKRGFELAGKATRKCEQDGLWQGVAPVCKGKRELRVVSILKENKSPAESEVSC